MRYKTYLKRCVLNAYLPWNGEANSKTMIKEIIHSISHAYEVKKICKWKCGYR